MVPRAPGLRRRGRRRHLAAKRDGPLGGIPDYLGAYHAVAVGRDELDVLFDLIVARLAMTVLITGWRATSPRTARAGRQSAGVDRPGTSRRPVSDAARAMLQDACKGNS